MPDMEEKKENTTPEETVEETVEEKSEETAEAEAEENTAEAAENEKSAETAAEESEESETSEEAGGGKKDKKDLEIADLKDRLIRQMAEFDNYRKRTDKEKKQNYEIGASDIIVKILPVIDNFERGLAGLTEEEKNGSFAQGIEMIYKQFMKTLEDLGVTPIEAVGKEFDPMLHNAVMQQPSEEYESGTVMQELQKGYMYQERVIRHSMVMVAQ